MPCVPVSARNASRLWFVACYCPFSALVDVVAEVWCGDVDVVVVERARPVVAVLVLVAGVAHFVARVVRHAVAVPAFMHALGYVLLVVAAFA